MGYDIRTGILLRFVLLLGLFVDRPKSSFSRYGQITELATGFPGYNGIMPKEKACYWCDAPAILDTIPSVSANGMILQILTQDQKDHLTGGLPER